MSDRLFLNEVDFYQRNIDPIRHYIEQSAIYLSKMTGDPIEKCQQWVETQLQNKSLPRIKDPIVKHFQRNEQGDRSQESTPLSRYIYSTIKEDRILAPTFTTYVHPRHKRSMLVGFIDRNVKVRSMAKKEAFKAKAAKNTLRYIMKNNEQNNMKIYNNSLSGAFATKGSVLNNPTAHSTLTSTTRSVSSFGNASNERVVMGNRNFFNPDIVIYSLLSTCQLIDHNLIENCMRIYQLNYPTTDQVMQCIHHSSQFYWKDHRASERIRALVDTLTPIEKAGFVYSGDLYHIRQFNSTFMFDFITALSEKKTDQIDDALSIVKTIDEQILNYAHQICFNEVKGLGKNYEQMKELSTVVATALNIIKVLEHYQLFIKAFFLSKIMPESHAHLPMIIRRSVVLSDTDSTCFSVDDWIKWYFGQIVFNEKTDSVAGAVAFITTQCIAHLLALFSANINVIPEKLHSLAMKNEFLWHVHMPTNVAKHYAALTVMQEGNVYAEPELEIKGVHLKNSASPPAIIQRAHTMIKEILNRVTENKRIPLLNYLKIIRDTEQEIIQSVLAGKVHYLKQSKIKEPEAYTKDVDESPYQHYHFWKDAFAYKYGDIDPPPFNVIKIPTTLNNKTKLKNWIEGIEDRQLADHIQAWLVKHKKTALNTIYISHPYASSYGIPQEILSIVDTRKVVLDLTLVFRIIVESLGFFIKKDWLISDYQF